MSIRSCSFLLAFCCFAFAIIPLQSRADELSDKQKEEIKKLIESEVTTLKDQIKEAADKLDTIERGLDEQISSSVKKTINDPAFTSSLAKAIKDQMAPVAPVPPPPTAFSMEAFRPELEKTVGLIQQKTGNNALFKVLVGQGVAELKKSDQAKKYQDRFVKAFSAESLDNFLNQFAELKKRVLAKTFGDATDNDWEKIVQAQIQVLSQAAEKSAGATPSVGTSTVADESLADEVATKLQARGLFRFDHTFSDTLRELSTALERVIIDMKSANRDGPSDEYKRKVGEAVRGVIEDFVLGPEARRRWIEAYEEDFVKQVEQSPRLHLDHTKTRDFERAVLILKAGLDKTRGVDDAFLRIAKRNIREGRSAGSMPSVSGGGTNYSSRGSSCKSFLFSRSRRGN